MRKVFAAAAALTTSLTGLVALGTTGIADAAQASGQGVTPTTIKVGVTYPDLSALKNVINVDPGNYPVAYTALFNQINKQGGLNGRKIVPVFAPVNPLGTAPAATACTQLTEDQKVFAVLGFFQQPDTACYVTTHTVPIIGASLTAQQAASAKGPWYNPIISDSDLAPKEMAYFKQHGVFSGKKIAVVGTNIDQPVVNVVLAALRAQGVPVVQTAINSVPDTDTAAQTQEYGTIAQKFQSLGVNEVVTVGNSGNGFPAALQSTQSNYRPRLVASNYITLDAYVSNKAGYTQSILKDAITAGGYPPPSVWFNDPVMKRCFATVHAAEPNAVINNPIRATASTPVTWTAPETACVQVALFADIVKAAGKTLNNQTFVKGASSLTHVALPGGGGTFNFSSGHNDGNGPVFVYQWSPKTNTLALKTTIG
jgi:ABC-type branched-subunit amino acid transport system substrate-binding protein